MTGLEHLGKCSIYALQAEKSTPKTLVFFARVAFTKLRVHFNYQAFSKVITISQHRVFAAKVRTCLLFGYDQAMCIEDYDKARKVSVSPQETSSQRRKAKQRIRRANSKQTENPFIERSATDGIMLALAFHRLHNLKAFAVLCADLREDRKSLRRRDYGEGPSTGRVFCVLLSSAAYASSKVETIHATNHGHFDLTEAVPVSTLSMPRAVLSSLSNLRRLELCLETSNLLYQSQLFHTYGYADCTER